MICQATYDSFEAIPEALRDEFENVNGKWQLKEAAVPGVGTLFNSALAKNEEKAVGQVKARNATIQALTTEKNTIEEERDSLRDELAASKVPGGKILSKEDAAQFDEYVKLGTVKDISGKIGELDTLKNEVTKFKQSSVNQLVAEKGGLNVDVLNEWAGSPDLENVEILVKQVTSNVNGKDVVKDVPYVQYEAEEAGKKTTRERELVEFAKEKMPDWKFQALTKAAVEDKKVVSNGSVRIPDLGSASGPSSKQVETTERMVDKFNAVRDARPNPLVPKAAAVR